MATRKQTTETESTAAPKKPAAATGKTGTAKQPAAETAAPPVEADAAKETKSTTAPKTTAAKGKKPAAQPSANGAAPATAAAPESMGTIKVFGEVEVTGKDFFIRNGSVPEGQLQLVVDKGKKQINDRIPGYNGQFVTVLGAYGKAKKTDKFPTFTVQNLTSHVEIAHRAFELSHDNPSTVEDNWFRAENELLNG